MYQYHKPFQLLYGALPETVTSMEASEGQGSLQDDERGGRYVRVFSACGHSLSKSWPPSTPPLPVHTHSAVPFRLVDAPGHPRLRSLWLSRVKDRGVKGVVLVVDAAEFGAIAVREAAE